MSLPAVDRPHRFSYLAAGIGVALFAGLSSGPKIAAADVSGTAAVDVIQEQAAAPLEPLATLRGRAEQGDLSAQVRLGNAYANGEGVEGDPAEAASWYLRAAERGDTDAQIKLARLYRTGGRGFDMDLVAALRWLTIASTVTPRTGGGNPHRPRRGGARDHT
jgi:hypothetical protein